MVPLEDKGSFLCCIDPPEQTAMALLPSLPVPQLAAGAHPPLVLGQDKEQGGESNVYMHTTDFLIWDE